MPTPGPTRRGPGLFPPQTPLSPHCRGCSRRDIRRGVNPVGMTTSWEASLGLNQTVRELDKGKPFLIKVTETTVMLLPRLFRRWRGLCLGAGEGAQDSLAWLPPLVSLSTRFSCCYSLLFSLLR